MSIPPVYSCAYGAQHSETKDLKTLTGSATLISKGRLSLATNKRGAATENAWLLAVVWNMKHEISPYQLERIRSP